MFAELRDISVYYRKSMAIKNVTISVPEAGVVSIIGANGAGKSTILKSLVGLVPIQSGDIVFNGERITGLETADRVKKGIVLVPEGRQLFPYLSVAPTSSWGRLFAGTERASPSPSSMSFSCSPASRSD
jgi:branched-chain amino acid transport system ATP-binding protein